MLLAACSGSDPSGEPETGGSAKASEGFVDVTEQLGIDFVHDDGRSGARYYPETVASGGGWIDFDDDGDLDLYLINGAATPGSPDPDRPRHNAFYENRDGTFVDITERSGLGDSGYGMGMCTGDYDGDGQIDLYLTNFGSDRLFRNSGVDAAPHFRDVSADAGIEAEGWGTNCAFSDVDGDGDLDLYVANYVDFRFEDNPRCGDSVRQIWSYCRPLVFDGQQDQLFINQGPGTDGTPRFVEEGVQRGIAQGTDDRGFGVVATDLTGDGRPELLIANDGTANRLYVNDGSGHFTDEALMSGLALDFAGRAQSGMGLDVGDVDGDLDLDVAVTNYSFEHNTIYLQQSRQETADDELSFEDRSMEVGVAGISRQPVGWGTRLFDADNDGDLDLVVANGHVMDNIDQFEELSYPQPDDLLLNDGEGAFVTAASYQLGDLARPGVSRGLAAGDWNNDGRVDLLITRTNDRPALLQNRLAETGNWLGVSLRGRSPNTSAIGARVTLLRDRSPWQLREVRSGGSVLSQSDLRLHFGLADLETVELEILWPSGARQRETVEPVNRYISFEESDS